MQKEIDFEEETQNQNFRMHSVLKEVIALLTWIFMAWHCTHSSFTIIKTKAHLKWKTLDEVCLPLHKVGITQ